MTSPIGGSGYGRLDDDENTPKAKKSKKSEKSLVEQAKDKPTEPPKKAKSSFFSFNRGAKKENTAPYTDLDSFAESVKQSEKKQNAQREKELENKEGFDSNVKWLEKSLPDLIKTHSKKGSKEILKVLTDLQRHIANYVESPDEVKAEEIRQEIKRFTSLI